MDPSLCQPSTDQSRHPKYQASPRYIPRTLRTSPHPLLALHMQIASHSMKDEPLNVNMHLQGSQYLSFLHLLRHLVSPNADHRSGCWNTHTPPQPTSLPTHACGSFQPHSFLFCTGNLAPGIQQVKLVNTVSAQSNCQVICKAAPKQSAPPRCWGGQFGCRSHRATKELLDTSLNMASAPKLPPQRNFFKGKNSL